MQEEVKEYTTVQKFKSVFIPLHEGGMVKLNDIKRFVKEVEEMVDAIPGEFDNNRILIKVDSATEYCGGDDCNFSYQTVNGLLATYPL